MTLTQQQLCQAVVSYAITHKITNLPAYVSALANWASIHNLGPLPRAALYDRVCKGLRNYYGEHNVSQPKSALSLSDLCCFRAHLDLDSFEGSRNWCAYLFSFFGLLRLREFCSPALTFHNVTPQRYGIDITVAFSKTCLVPVQVVLVRRDDQLCPLAAYQQYIRHIDYRLRLATSSFFRLTANRTKPLEPSVFIHDLRSLIQSALSDRDPSEFAGHSFRRGGTRAMFMALVPETVIAAHGRWKSLAYRRYFDKALPQRMLATAHLRLAAPLSPPDPAARL
ncbi:MAG: hypothetical protein JWL77_7112 [Chthonomonadaceae bacterium]|nr:hypothetical protein [Chthonomonadaceae bacterium]